MKHLLSFPRARRLQAYHYAGNRLVDHPGFSCLALNAALFEPGVVADVEPQFWWHLFGSLEEGDTVETRDARWPRFDLLRGNPTNRTEVNDLRNAIGVDAHQTRLMMLAWAHALDEAGDLEDILS